MKVEMRTFEQVNVLLSDPALEALVVMGTGGNIDEWVTGLNEILIDKNLITKPVEDWYLMTTTGGRYDLVMPLPDEGIDVGKFAAWKANTSCCSWWSDYRVNYAKQH